MSKCDKTGCTGEKTKRPGRRDLYCERCGTYFADQPAPEQKIVVSPGHSFQKETTPTTEVPNDAETKTDDTSSEATVAGGEQTPVGDAGVAAEQGAAQPADPGNADGEAVQPEDGRRRRKKRNHQPDQADQT